MPTANAGYKAFATGDVLTAAQVQYNLQNQTIMFFASSAARNTALSGVVVEGMFSYLADTNAFEYYDGAAWQSVSNPGDITGVTAGTGLSGGGSSGTVTLSIDTGTTVDLTTAQTLTNKTLTSPLINLGINANTSTTYTFVLADNGKLVTSNNASAKVQIDSTTQGVLFPRMTAAQRTAIATPAEGLIVVQTDGTQGLYLYIGAAWHAITML